MSRCLQAAERPARRVEDPAHDAPARSALSQFSSGARRGRSWHNVNASNSSIGRRVGGVRPKVPRSGRAQAGTDRRARTRPRSVIYIIRAMRPWARLVTTTIRRSGAPEVMRHLVAKRRVSILLYHDPAPETIAEHLDYLRSRYHGVSLTRVVDAMRSGEWSALPDYSLAITFDDGWSRNVESVRMCRGSGFPVTIFACSAIIDTKRHYWWTATEQPEPLKHLPTPERLAILEARGFRSDREYSDGQALSREESGVHRRRCRDRGPLALPSRPHGLLGRGSVGRDTPLEARDRGIDRPPVQTLRLPERGVHRSRARHGSAGWVHIGADAARRLEHARNRPV